MSAGTPAPFLPPDKHGEPIQVLSPHSSTAVVTGSASSARVALPTGAQILEISLSGSMHIRFGDSSVDAATTDFFLPEGFVGTYKVPDGATHLAAIWTSGETGGNVYIHKLV